ncbi:hypothetical protein TNCV_2981251 [Trichonephila clavipes]|nr:hypothetical protein TNCV_2981251 [Trichonephila clavipes]
MCSDTLKQALTELFPVPDGRGYELVSSVRTLVPQKFSVEEELMHVKHVDVKSPHVGVMWKFGRGVISSAGHPVRGLKKHKQLKLDMREEKLLDPVISRLEPQLLDYVEVQQSTAKQPREKEPQHGSLRWRSGG